MYTKEMFRPEVEPDALFIHTSDRLSFKRCRQRWNWVSDLREGLKPAAAPMPLTFGTAIHAALEVWYEPDTWHLTRNGMHAAVLANALATFLDSMRQSKIRYLKAMKTEALNEEQQADYDRHLELGQGMIKAYAEYSLVNDNHFKPILTEVPFRIQIATVKGRPVYYQGRLDAIMEDSWGDFWIWDHKTTARMRDNLGFLELDEQLGSYNWAITELGLPIRGNVYNELFKGVAGPPIMNKVQRQGRWFSVNKQQDTSYEMYLQTLKDHDEPLELYEEMLQYLKAEGKTYFRRTQVHRSRTELENIHQRILLEMSDMLNDPHIYPNPSPFSCDGCPFRPPCVAKQDGSDVDWILQTNYVREKRT